jgi:hypothetical protein
MKDGEEEERGTWEKEASAGACFCPKEPTPLMSDRFVAAPVRRQAHPNGQWTGIQVDEEEE